MWPFVLLGNTNTWFFRVNLCPFFLRFITCRGSFFFLPAGMVPGLRDLNWTVGSVLD